MGASHVAMAADWIAYAMAIVVEPVLIARIKQHYDRLGVEAPEYYEGIEPLRWAGFSRKRR